MNSSHPEAELAGRTAGSTAERAEVVSVIIPAYNAANYIKETLDSVFLQTYPHFEVIVVNDGSPDTLRLEEVLLPYRDAIVYLRQENRGLSGARNTGIRAATGSMVALLDADDIWMPDYLEVQTQFLREHPDVDLVYCNATFFGDSVYAGKKYMDVCPSTGVVTAAALIDRRCHVFVSVTARAEVLRSIGFDEALRSCEDYDCWLRLVAAGYKIGYHRRELVRYRKHSASLSANLIKMAEFNLAVLEKAGTLWAQGSTEAGLLRAATEKKTAALQILRCKEALRNQDVETARVCLQAANTYYKSRKHGAILYLLQRNPGLVRKALHLRGLLFRAHREEGA